MVMLTLALPAGHHLGLPVGKHINHVAVVTISPDVFQSGGRRMSGITRVGMIGAGSGITPLYQLINVILDNPEDTTPQQTGDTTHTPTTTTVTPAARPTYTRCFFTNA